MPTLSFTCPNCGKQYDRVKHEMIGYRVKCVCGNEFRLGEKKNRLPGVDKKFSSKRRQKSEPQGVAEELFTESENASSKSRPGSPAAARSLNESSLETLDLAGDDFTDIESLYPPSDKDQISELTETSLETGDADGVTTDPATKPAPPADRKSDFGNEENATQASEIREETIRSELGDQSVSSDFQSPFEDLDLLQIAPEPEPINDLYALNKKPDQKHNENGLKELPRARDTDSDVLDVRPLGEPLKQQPAGKDFRVVTPGQAPKSDKLNDSRKETAGKSRQFRGGSNDELEMPSVDSSLPGHELGLEPLVPDEPDSVVPLLETHDSVMEAIPVQEDEGLLDAVPIDEPMPVALPPTRQVSRPRPVTRSSRQAKSGSKNRETLKSTGGPIGSIVIGAFTGIAFGVQMVVWMIALATVASALLFVDDNNGSTPVLAGATISFSIITLLQVSMFCASIWLFISGIVELRRNRINRAPAKIAAIISAIFLGYLFISSMLTIGGAMMSPSTEFQDRIANQSKNVAAMVVLKTVISSLLQSVCPIAVIVLGFVRNMGSGKK